jgi:putative cobalt transporter subunit CbtB
LDKPTKALNTPAIIMCKMSILKQLTKQAPSVPRIAIGILVAILVFTMFIVGYDQGLLFSIVQGQEAFDGMWLHEFTHDMRHAAGFPCH